MLVDFAEEAPECFFADFFVVFVGAGVLAIFELEAGAGEGAVAWAKSETPASAIVIVSPMIVLFIFVFLFVKRVFCSLLSL